MKKILMIIIDIIIFFSGYIIFGKLSAWLVSKIFAIVNIKLFRLAPIFLWFMIFMFFMIVIISKVITRINKTIMKK